MNDPNMKANKPQGFNPGATAFNISPGEFVPAGTIAKTQEQFPDLVNLGEDEPKRGKGKKKKKRGPQVQEPKKNEEDEQLQWKGKPSSFFDMKQLDGPGDAANPNNYEMTQKQWSFMYQYYPEYCTAPYDMMIWLRGQAQAHEERYAKPGRGGVQTGGAPEEEEEAVMAPERRIGMDFVQGKQKGKKDTKAQQQQ